MNPTNEYFKHADGCAKKKEKYKNILRKEAI